MRELHEDEAPGNKVLLAVSRSFGGCSQCGMVFPERLRTAPSSRRSSSKKARLSEDTPDIVDEQVFPDGVYKDESDPDERTWYHIPNFGRKFFDALRKYYMVRENGQEIRVSIKRPDKDSYCTWVGIVGHPRHYSTGGKRPKVIDDRSLFEPIARFKSVTLSSAPMPDQPADESSNPPYTTTAQPMQLISRSPSPELAREEFAYPEENDSPMTRSHLLNKNACLQMTAMEWFPADVFDRLAGF